MYWKEVRQLGGAHKGRRLPLTWRCHARFFLLSCRSRHVGQTRTRLPLSLSLLITTPNAWAKTGTRLRAALDFTTLSRPAISNSPPPPPPDSRTPTTPPVSLPPGIQKPSASDADLSFAGFRPVDCSLPLRVDDAFSIYRNDSDWADAWQVGPSCLAGRRDTLFG